MAQNNVTNLWIQDANGQPQMIKVLHASHRTGTGGTKTTYRVLKTPGQDAAAINSVLSNPQVLQTLAAVRGPRTPGQRQVVAIPLANASSNSATAATGGPLPGVKVENVKSTGAAAALQLINSPLVLATTPQTPRLKTSTVSVISTPLQPPQNQNQNQNHNNNSKSQNQNQNPSQTPTPSQPQPSHASAKAAFISPILDHSGSRKRHEIEYEHGVESKRRRVDKGGKGLRHFSMKVCEKVQKKGTTSYNEVADELVAEFSDPIRCASPADQYDQKNIRRRVYDALNVLMAMNIISKEKKEIKWLGLPTNSLQEFQALEMEKQRRLEKIRSKTQQLQDLVLQQIAFKSLVQRNKKAEKQHSSPSSSSVIQLPFIVVNTSKKTVIDCSISNDKTEYLFSFDDTFEIHDDIEVLKRMGMALGLDKANCSSSDLIIAKSYVPKALEGYVDQLAKGQKEPELPEGITSTSSEFTDIERCNNGNQRPGTATPSLSTNDGFSEEEMDEEEDSDVEVN